MRRKIYVGIIIVVCFLLQCTIFKALSIASVSPNLMIVVVASFGFLRGKKEGMVIGLICGLLIDIFCGNIFGLYGLFYLLIGYMNGIFRRLIYPDDIKIPMLLILSSDLCVNLIQFLVLFLPRGKYYLGYYLMHIIIPEMIYTMIVGVFLYVLLMSINKKLEKQEKRSAIKFV